MTKTPKPVPPELVDRLDIATLADHVGGDQLLVASTMMALAVRWFRLAGGTEAARATLLAAAGRLEPAPAATTHHPPGHA